MINFCHISPVSTLRFVEKYKTHLLLAHLVEENLAYRNFYVALKRRDPSVFYHLDNSAFEMFKRGEPMYPADKLVEMAKIVNANSIVMSDYPKEFWLKTVDSAVELIPKIKAEGFKTFFCPQSRLGEIDDLVRSFEWAINNPDIDYIGVSILACPIGLGVDEQKFGDGQKDESYRMQRYLARWRVFQILEQNNLLSEKTHKRFHCLGMTDGPREIDILRPYHDHIFSWDSSSAIWHGIHKIAYDTSPTGLRRGKFEQEVEFNIDLVDDISCITYNMDIVDNMCGR